MITLLVCVWVSSNALPLLSFPGSSVGEESAWNVGDLSSLPGSGRSPEEGNIHSLQDSCLENSMDRGSWQATVHGVVERDTIEWLTQQQHGDAGRNWSYCSAVTSWMLSKGSDSLEIPQTSTITPEHHWERKASSEPGDEPSSCTNRTEVGATKWVAL